MKSAHHAPSYFIKAGCLGLVGLLLMACQHTAISIDVNNQPYLNAIPAGSELVLQRDLVVPAKMVRVYLQYGKQHELSGLDKYQPWCELEIKTLDDRPQTINADSFAILKLVNQRSGLLDGAGLGSISNTLEEFSTVLYLQSMRQPDVMRLSCLWRRGTRMQTYLRLADIQSALGDIVTFNIK
jgi:hypothetical protein